MGMKQNALCSNPSLQQQRCKHQLKLSSLFLMGSSCLLLCVLSVQPSKTGSCAQFLLDSSGFKVCFSLGVQGLSL